MLLGYGVFGHFKYPVDRGKAFCSYPHMLHPTREAAERNRAGDDHYLVLEVFTYLEDAP